MRLAFTKMNGLGNDFIVINALESEINLTTAQRQHLADRKFGIGCDQILLVEPATHAEADFFFRIYNSDGSEAEQCGNGARCFARYIRDNNLSEKASIIIDTLAGPLTLNLMDDGQVQVNMGIPQFGPEQIPVLADTPAMTYPVVVNDEVLPMAAVSMGNPHAVWVVDSTENAPVIEVGEALQNHGMFPEKANVEFMEICSRNHIKLRIYERGAGETLACGSGACGAVAAGIHQGLLDSQVTVEMPGGKLLIEWPGGDQPLWMTGPATTVFEGSIEF